MDISNKLCPCSTLSCMDSQPLQSSIGPKITWLPLTTGHHPGFESPNSSAGRLLTSVIEGKSLCLNQKFPCGGLFVLYLPTTCNHHFYSSQVILNRDELVERTLVPTAFYELQTMIPTSKAQNTWLNLLLSGNHMLTTWSKFVAWSQK
jgi:hypothetical protein